MDLFGGQEGYELVHIPALARVERYGLAAASGNAPADAPRIGGMLVASGPWVLDAATLTRVSEILRDDASYDWNALAGPATKPAQATVALRFAGVKRTIDVLYSPGDRGLVVYQGDQRIGRARLGPRGDELATLLAPANR